MFSFLEEDREFTYMHTYVYTQQINPHTHYGLYFNNFFNGNDYICDNCLIYLVWSVHYVVPICNQRNYVCRILRKQMKILNMLKRYENNYTVYFALAYFLFTFEIESITISTKY